MNNLKKMYLKEMKGERDSIIGHLFIIAAFFLLLSLLAVMRRWDQGVLAGVFLLPLFLLPIWYLYYSFDIMHREWKEKTFPLLMSLPLDSKTILAAKMGSLWSTYLFLVLAISIGGALVGGLDYGLWEASMNAFLVAWGVTLTQLVLLIPFTPVAFFIYFLGVSFPRGASVLRALAAAVLLGTIYFGYQLMHWLLGRVHLHISIPETLVNRGDFPTAMTFSNMSPSLGLIISALLVGIICFFLSAYLLEEKPGP